MYHDIPAFGCARSKLRKLVSGVAPSRKDSDAGRFRETQILGAWAKNRAGGIRNRQDDVERVRGGWDDCEPDGRWYRYNEPSLHRRGVPEADN